MNCRGNDIESPFIVFGCNAAVERFQAVLRNAEDNIIYICIKHELLMSYYVSYTSPLGYSGIRCYGWELAGILRNMVYMALRGHEFSNVTITKI